MKVVNIMIKDNVEFDFLFCNFIVPKGTKVELEFCNGNVKC